MHRQSGIALIAFVLALQLLSLEVSAQTCPITTKKANSLSFSGVKKSCGKTMQTMSTMWLIVSVNQELWILQSTLRAMLASVP